MCVFLFCWQFSSLVFCWQCNLSLARPCELRLWCIFSEVWASNDRRVYREATGTASVATACIGPFIWRGGGNQRTRTLILGCRWWCRHGVTCTCFTSAAFWFNFNFRKLGPPAELLTIPMNAMEPSKNPSLGDGWRILVQNNVQLALCSYMQCAFKKRKSYLMHVHRLFQAIDANEVQQFLLSSDNPMNSDSESEPDPEGSDGESVCEPAGEPDDEQESHSRCKSCCKCKDHDQGLVKCSASPLPPSSQSESSNAKGSRKRKRGQ